MRALILDAILYEGTHFPPGEIVDLPSHVYDLHRAAGRVTTPTEAELVEAARAEADAFLSEAASSGEEAALAARSEEPTDLRAVLSGHLSEAGRHRLIECIRAAGLDVPRGNVQVLRDLIMNTAAERGELVACIAFFDPPPAGPEVDDSEPKGDPETRDLEPSAG